MFGDMPCGCIGAFSLVLGVDFVSVGFKVTVFFSGFFCCLNILWACLFWFELLLMRFLSVCKVVCIVP